MKTKTVLFVFFIVAVVVLSSCAHATNIEACRSGHPYGFLPGLWHGFIAPWSLLGSIFNHNIAMYAVDNSGWWYNFGFAWGAGIIFGSGARVVKTKKKVKV